MEPLRRFTAEDIDQLGACYTHRETQRWFTKKPTLNVKEVLELDLSAADALWVVMAIGLPQPLQRLASRQAVQWHDFRRDARDAWYDFVEKFGAERTYIWYCGAAGFVCGGGANEADQLRDYLYAQLVAAGY